MHSPRPGLDARRNRRTVIALSLAWSAGAAVLMLLAVLGVAALCAGYVHAPAEAPPLVAGDLHDTASVLSHNLLVLALYAGAAVAAYLALRDRARPAAPPVRQYVGRLAIATVLVAVGYSLGRQTYVLGRLLAGTSGYLNVPTSILELGLLPHAVLELSALFLPLSAAALTIRRRDAGDLLAVAVTSVAIALPLLTAAAVIEVYVSPTAYHALACTGIGDGTAAQGGCTPSCPKLSPLQFEKRYHIQLPAVVIKAETAGCKWPVNGAPVANDVRSQIGVSG